MGMPRGMNGIGRLDINTISDYSDRSFGGGGFGFSVGSQTGMVPGSYSFTEGDDSDPWDWGGDAGGTIWDGIIGGARGGANGGGRVPHEDDRTHGGGSDADAARGIIAAIGNAVSSVASAVTGNYPRNTTGAAAAAQNYNNPRTAGAYREDGSLDQASGDLLTFIKRNSTLLLVAGIGFMLFRSGRK